MGLGAFNPEDEVSWDELAPSLQALLNAKANIVDMQNNSTITLTNDASGSTTLPYDETKNIAVHVYRTDLAYNIPVGDVGGNIWIEKS